MAVRDWGSSDESSDRHDADPPGNSSNTPRSDFSADSADDFPAFLDVDPRGVPHELSLVACPFCSRMIRPEADVCHRCGNFLLHATPRHVHSVRWILALLMFVATVLFLVHAGIIRP